MLDKFLAIEDISPDLALMAALSKQGHRLKGVADELERLSRFPFARSVSSTDSRATPPDLTRIATWLTDVANVMCRLSQYSGSRLTATGGVGDP